MDEVQSTSHQPASPQPEAQGHDDQVMAMLAAISSRIERLKEATAATPEPMPGPSSAPDMPPMASGLSLHTNTITSGTAPAFHSNSISISQKIDDKVKGKIWANQYIDMAEMLGKKGMDTFHLEMAKEVDTSSLQFVQATSFSKLPFFQ